MAVTAVANRSQPQSPASDLRFDPDHPALRRARENAAGASPLTWVTPDEAWELVTLRAAILLDVRTGEERKFVGHVPGSLHLPWLLGTALQTNPRFLRELQAKVPRDAVLLLLCRSGQRAAAAAAAAAKAGFSQVYPVLEGFEGELDDRQQRNRRNGWRFRDLPWVQE